MLAAERATLLLGCYRRTDAMDPDTYVLAMATVLAVYEEWVILEATHPRTGIQATDKFKSWPPNSGELKQFCDDLAKRAARYALYEKLPKPNFAPRLPPPPRPAPDVSRPSLEDLAKRHADMEWAQRVLQQSSDSGPRTPQQRLQIYNEMLMLHGRKPLSQAEFDAIPDAPLAINWK